MNRNYWIVEAHYIPLSRQCVILRWYTVEADNKPPIAIFPLAGRTVYRESFTRKSRALRRVDHIYAKNPQLDD
jgi:hypothetical protein